mgnify:CR=1 FL=1
MMHDEPFGCSVSLAALHTCWLVFAPLKLLLFTPGPPVQRSAASRTTSNICNCSITVERQPLQPELFHANVVQSHLLARSQKTAAALCALSHLPALSWHWLLPCTAPQRGTACQAHFRTLALPRQASYGHTPAHSEAQYISFTISAAIAGASDADTDAAVARN